MGLARETDGIGAAVLQQLGVDLEQVRAATLAALAPGVNPTTGDPKLTPKAKRVLELGANEARRMRHNYIGTEHLLLALLREKDGLACSVLRELGLTLENTRAQVTVHLGEMSAPTAATSSDSLDVAASSRVSDDVRELLYFAAQGNREVGAAQVEIVHLLRALCRAESESARILSDAGVDVAALWTRLQE